MDLNNTCAIVTGGTKGIGLAVAETLLKEGASVVICSRTQTELEQVVTKLQATFDSKVTGRTCDVGNAEEWKKLVAHCVQKFGGLDVLINNAGIGIFKPVEQLSVQDWRATQSTNLDSLFYGCHFALPEMKKRGEGFIINIGSLAGKNAFPSGAAYNASKFGLIGFSEALMQEVRYDNIRVAYIMPGSVNTWFGEKPPDEKDSWKLAAQDVADVVVDTLKRHPRCLTSRIEMRPSRPPRK